MLVGLLKLKATHFAFLIQASELGGPDRYHDDQVLGQHGGLGGTAHAPTRAGTEEDGRSTLSDVTEVRDHIMNLI